MSSAQDSESQTTGSQSLGAEEAEIVKAWLEPLASPPYHGFGVNEVTYTLSFLFFVGFFLGGGEEKSSTVVMEVDSGINSAWVRVSHDFPTSHTGQAS